MTTDYAKYFTDAGYTLITKDIPTKKTKVMYICQCGETKTKTISDFMKQQKCRTCTEKATKMVPDKPEYKDNETGEIWKPIVGGWISSFGNAKNVFDKPLILCNTKYRYYIGGENQCASRLVANAFKIQDYEKLKSAVYAVSHLDGNPRNNKIENLVVVSKSDIGSKNGLKSRKSDLCANKITWGIDKFADLDYKIVEELPNHIIHSNGEIWNGKRFLTFSKVENSYQFIQNDISYKVDKLVCYAFHPILDKKKLSDYEEFEVVHKDGDKTNNSSDNLEWKTIEKILGKRGQCVIQFSKDGEKLGEFESIGRASKETGDSEYIIKSCAKGLSPKKAKYSWKFKNDLI